MWNGLMNSEREEHKRIKQENEDEGKENMRKRYEYDKINIMEQVMAEETRYRDIGKVWRKKENKNINFLLQEQAFCFQYRRIYLMRCMPSTFLL